MRLTDEQKDFAWRNMGAGIFHSRRVRKARPRLGRLDRETIDQEVAAAVCSATATYDESRGAFSTHVESHVRQGLQTALMRDVVVRPPRWYAESYYKIPRSDEAVRAAKRCFGRTLQPVPSDRVADDVLDEVCAREFRDRVLRVLTPRPREVVRRYYFEGQGFERIAAEMGVTHQRVQQLHAGAIERLSLLDFD